MSFNKITYEQFDVLGHEQVNAIQDELVKLGNHTHAPGDVGAYSLVRGTAIPSNDDLDTYTAPGNYICQTTATAGTLANSPVTTTGFSLHVEIVSGASNNYLHQTLRANNETADVWKRRYHPTSGWGEWSRLVTADEVVKKSGDTMTGDLNIVKNSTIRLDFQDTKNGGGRLIRLQNNYKNVQLTNYLDADNFSMIQVLPEASDLSSVLRYRQKFGGTETVANILHEGNMASMLSGYAKVASGSYKGTGTSGSSNPTTITIPFTPKLVIISSTTYNNEGNNNLAIIPATLLTSSYKNNVIYNASAMANMKVESYVYAAIENNTLKIYYQAGTSTGGEGSQFNISGKTYHWIAIG